MTRRRLFCITASTLALLASSGCNKQKAPATCNDAALTPEQKGLRTAVAYVDRTLIAAQTCDRCQQWVPPASVETCGGCKVVPGPIHPQGYCKLFAPS